MTTTWSPRDTAVTETLAWDRAIAEKNARAALAAFERSIISMGELYEVTRQALFAVIEEGRNPISELHARDRAEAWYASHEVNALRARLKEVEARAPAPPVVPYALPTHLVDATGLAALEDTLLKAARAMPESLPQRIFWILERPGEEAA